METGSRDYVTIPKGRGYVYVYENQLYNRIKTEGSTKYLKCDVPDVTAQPRNIVNGASAWGQMSTLQG